MTDHPLEFTKESAAGLWTNNKTQTRRLATSPIAKFEIGDRIYVREPFRIHPCYDQTPPKEISPDIIFYEANHMARFGIPEAAGKRRPGRYMPKSYSRMTLTIIDIRTQNLRDMTNADAIAEGVSPVGYTARAAHLQAYRELWNTLHPTQTWARNPQIIALTFAMRPQNIDAIKDAA